MINYKVKKIFKSTEFNEQFADLFYTDGPLYYILQNYPNIPAKGGSKFLAYKDTSYFIHVLNTAYIGGLLLENELLSRDVNLSNQIYNIKLFFGSCVYHDFNKLEGKNIWKPDDYKDLLDNKEQVLIKMLQFYFKGYDIDDVIKKIKYIILNVENSSKDLENTTDIKDKRILLYISEYVSKGDSLSSQMSKNNSEFEILKQVKSELSSIPGLRVIEFQKIPQTVLRNTVIKYTESFFDGNIVLKSPDWIIVNRPFEYSELSEYIISKLIDTFNNIKNIASEYSPSSNKVDLRFYERIPVTKEFLEVFMDTHRENLLLYQKIKDIDEKYHTYDVLKLWNFDINNNGKVTYYEDTGDEFDKDIKEKSLRIRTAILRRMELELDNIDTTEEEKVFHEHNIDIENIEKITQKTLLALAYSFIHNKDIENTYSEIMDRLLNIFKSKRDNIDNNLDEVYKEVFNKVFLTKLKLSNEIASKDKLCIQCGSVYNNTKVEKINSFGIKATSGTGSKISVLEYNRYDGEICELCRLENTLRKNTFKGKGNLCIQIYTGDYLPPIDVNSILTTVAAGLNSDSNLVKGEENIYNAQLTKYTQVPVIDHHNLYFIDKPGSTDKRESAIIPEFMLLRNIIKLIQKSGLKIKLTAMFIAGDTFYYTFKWESPPGWVKEFSMDEIRIDKINDSVYLLDLISKISSLGRGYKDLPEVISSILQNKMNIYNLIWSKIVSNNIHINFKLRKFLYGKNENEPDVLEKYEEMFEMEEKKNRMKELVDIACRIDHDAPTSNNDNTWIIRTAFHVYENNRLNKDHRINKDYTDIKEKISGNLFDLASRRNKQKSSDMQNACVDFGNEFVEYILDEYGDIPKQEIKRDIISQFGLLYNINKWNIVKENSKNKEVKK